MNIEAMLQLRRVMEEADADHFYMGNVLHGGNVLVEARVPPGAGEEDQRHLLTKCGTSACVMGWAALDGWFRSQGVLMKGHNFDLVMELLRKVLDLSTARFDDLFMWNHEGFKGMLRAQIKPADVVRVIDLMIAEASK